MKKYPFVKPVMPDLKKLIPSFEKIWESNWYSNFGQYSKKLETLIADYYEIDHERVVTCSNATIGLILAIKTLKWKKDDEVLTPSYTFPATVQAIQWNNLNYRYVDIRQDTHHACIYPKHYSMDKNVLLVFPYGCPNSFKGFHCFNSVIVDAAASLGNRSRNMLFTIKNADATVFSLHATKVMGIGEGGIVIFRNNLLAKRFRKLSNFGFTESRDTIQGGMNGKLCELLSAVGVEKMKDIKKTISKLSKVTEIYREHMKGFESPINNVLYENHPWQFIPVFLKDCDRDTVRLKMKKSGIDAGIYYEALHYTSNEPYSKLTTTEDISSRTLSLPIYTDMTEKDVKYITDSLKESI